MFSLTLLIGSCAAFFSVLGICALPDPLVKFLDFYISSAVNCCFFFVVVLSAVINELFPLCACSA